MQTQSMLIRHRCTARSMAHRAKPTAIPPEIVAGGRTRTPMVIIQLMLTLQFASRPPAEVSRAARLRRIFEPHYKYLAADLPEPRV
jgi:hypothetical protein